jgi:serine/arginine repetitive matrix protein 1
MAGNFFRGTSVEQDGRWGKSDQKLMAKMAKSGLFAPILETKVTPKKVNLDVINKWITQKIIEVVGFEDDILINLVINILQEDEVDGKKMQMDVTGFLEKQAPAFVEELWGLLVDAQGQPSGIPSVFLQKKKEEILSRQQQGSRWSSLPQGATTNAGKQSL